VRIKKPQRSEASTSPLRIKSPQRSEASTSPLRTRSPQRSESPARTKAEHEELKQTISDERATNCLLQVKLEALQADYDQLKAEMEELQASQIKVQQNADRETAVRVREEAQRTLEKAEEVWRMATDNEQLRAANERLTAAKVRAELERGLVEAALRQAEAEQHALKHEAMLAEAAMSHLQAVLTSVWGGVVTAAKVPEGGRTVPNRHRKPQSGVVEYACGRHDAMLMPQAYGSALARVLGAGISLGRGIPPRSFALARVKARSGDAASTDAMGHHPLHGDLTCTMDSMAGSYRAGAGGAISLEYEHLQGQRQLLKARREELTRGWAAA